MEIIRYKDFLIRPAKNEDIRAIKNVVYPVLAEYGLKPSEAEKDSDLMDIERSYFARNGFFAVALNIHSDTVVGTIGLYAISKDDCELRKMYLQKEFRGKGLGQFMLGFVIDIARQKGFKRVLLETISPLKIAIAMYRKAGFTEIKPKEISDRVDQAFQLIL